MKRSKLESSSLWYVSGHGHKWMHHENKLAHAKACSTSKKWVFQLNLWRASKLGQRDNRAGQFACCSDFYARHAKSIAQLYNLKSDLWMGTSSSVQLWSSWQRDWFCCMTCRTWLVLSVWRNQCPQVSIWLNTVLTSWFWHQHIIWSFERLILLPIMSMTPANSCHISLLPECLWAPYRFNITLLYQVCMGCPANSTSDHVFEVIWC